MASGISSAIAWFDSNRNACLPWKAGLQRPSPFTIRGELVGAACDAIFRVVCNALSIE